MTDALDAHRAALTDFRAQVSRIPADRWHVPPAANAWSPAEETLHVVLAYEVALASVSGGDGMRLRVSPVRAALLRWLFLPYLLRTGKFPRVAAPREIRPPGDEARTLTPIKVLERLDKVANAAAHALHNAALQTPKLRLTHAYFGALRPLTSLRLLSVHTRHHARRLARRASAFEQA